MQWQDVVLTIGQLVLTLSLLPTVFSKDKPVLITSISFGAILMTFSITFATLALWFTTLTTFLGSLTWFLIAFQKYSQERAKI